MTKIYWGRDLIGRFTCDGRKYTKLQIIRMRIARTIKRSLIVLSIITVSSWIAVGGYQYAKSNIAPVTVFAEKTVEVAVDSPAPVMDRIAKCESGKTQTRNGQTLININSNGTYDQGKFQINSIWNKKATELGYNLSVEKDNEAFAMWLYKNFGTEPWSSSRASCWNK